MRSERTVASAHSDDCEHQVAARACRTLRDIACLKRQRRATAWSYLIESNADAAQCKWRWNEASVHAVEAGSLHEIAPVGTDDGRPDDQRQRDEEQKEETVEPRDDVETRRDAVLATEPAGPSAVPEVLEENGAVAQNVHSAAAQCAISAHQAHMLPRQSQRCSVAAQYEIGDKQALDRDRGDDEAVGDKPDRKGERTQLAGALEAERFDQLRGSTVQPRPRATAYRWRMSRRSRDSRRMSRPAGASPGRPSARTSRHAGEQTGAGLAADHAAACSACSLIIAVDDGADARRRWGSRRQRTGRFSDERRVTRGAMGQAIGSPV